jgi:hypothetical protein
MSNLPETHFTRWPSDSVDPIVYPERAERLLTDGDERRLNRLAVQDKLIRAIDRLSDAMAEYAVASADLVEATVAEHDAKAELECLTDEARADLYSQGVPGKNEAERSAFVANALWANADVRDARNAHEAKRDARIRVEGRFRICDMSQKNLREIVRGLGAALNN